MAIPNLLYEVTIMFQFINDLCKRTARPVRRQHRRATLKFESLENRLVLAANMWAAIGPPPQTPTEQVSIIFPALHKVELIQHSARLAGGISPEFKPVGHIDPSFRPVGYIHWNIKPLGIVRPDIPVGMITPAGHENPPWKG
jgi:hypothetical protein